MAEKSKKTTKSTAEKTKSAKTSETKKATKTPAKEVKSTSEKFAVIELGGSQLKVEEGKKYEVEKLDGKKGDKIEINEVLLVQDGDDLKIGAPHVEGAKVTLQIDAQKKDKKLDVFKFKSKSRYRRTYGHRQSITRVFIEKIA